MVATYRFVFIELEFRLIPSGTVPFRPKPRCHGTCMAQNANASPCPVPRARTNTLLQRAVPTERTLVPNDDARLGETRFEDWLSRSVPQK